MSIMVAALIGLPLLGAALILFLGPLLKKIPRAADCLGMAIAAAELGLALRVLAGAGGGETVVWFGGWTPRPHGIAIGVAAVADGVSAALVVLIAFLVLCALIYSWKFFADTNSFYQALMLGFLGGMAGFALAGDLFTMFVFFEVMGVAAYALTSYRIEERGPLQGALNFAVTNTIAGFLALTGIGLVYGRTGALNMAQAGATLAGKPPDALVLVAFTLITVGLLVKASVFPFHLWLADAHAVAPSPVCALFSGVMVELGIYALARVYWTVFDGALAMYRPAITAVLMAFGVATAIAAALLCLRQHHIKRLQAFSTISYAGVLLCGVALLAPLGMGAVLIFIAGHGLVKAALFLGSGVLLYREESISEGTLHGKGRAAPGLGFAYAFGGLLLSGLPPFALALGKSLLEDAASNAGMIWLIVIVIFSSVMTGGAVLRVALHVFLGWGKPAPSESGADNTANEERSERSKKRHNRTPVMMAAPIWALLLAAIALGLWPHLGPHAQAAAALFQDRPAQVANILQSRAIADNLARPPLALATATPTATAVILGFVSVALAIVVALLQVLPSRLPVRINWLAERAHDFIHPLRTMQSGQIGDYVTWMVVGSAVLGVALLLIVR